MRVLVLAAVVGLLATGTAQAGPILDRIRHDGIVRCAVVERPGFAEMAEDGPSGRAVDLCRAVTRAVLGPQGKLGFDLLDIDADFDPARAGKLDLLFLTPREAAEQKLAGLATAGEAEADRFALMVPERSAAQAPRDLKDRTICFMIGDPVWPVLDAAMRGWATPFRPFGFSEEVEMKDAYNVGRCDAMAGVASTLDELRQDGGVRHIESRILAEPLGPDPVMALVPSGDADWAQMVRGVMGSTAPPAGAD